MSQYTSIERAITAVFNCDQPLTINTALVAYLYIIGEGERYVPGNSVPQEIITAFEHALDKHPAAPAQTSRARCHRLYVPEIARLRSEYWMAKSGSDNGAIRCRCSNCGRTVGYTRAGLEHQSEGLDYHGTGELVARRRKSVLSA